MSDTDAVLSQALEAMDLEDADIAAEANDKGGSDAKDNQEKDTTDAGTSKSTTSEDNKESGPARDSDKSDTGNDDDAKESQDRAAETDGQDEEEGQYTADDALEVDDTPTPANSAPVDQSGVQLSAAEQKYVIDNIGEPVVLNGYKLDKDGNQVDYTVKAYAANQIPRDFNFTSQVDQLQAVQAFNGLEQKANTLLQQKRSDDSRSAAADYQRRENEAIQSDVAELQKEGRLPKFRVRPGEAGFDEDPGAQIIDEVLKIMADKNQKYYEDSQKGKAYRHIGFEQAFDIYERTNPARQAARKADADQANEDKARKTKAERGDSNRGDAPKNIMKATVPAGTTTRDLMAMLDAEEL